MSGNLKSEKSAFQKSGEVEVEELDQNKISGLVESPTNIMLLGEKVIPVDKDSLFMVPPIATTKVEKWSKIAAVASDIKSEAGMVGNWSQTSPETPINYGEETDNLEKEFHRWKMENSVNSGENSREDVKSRDTGSHSSSGKDPSRKGEIVTGELEGTSASSPLKEESPNKSPKRANSSIGSIRRITENSPSTPIVRYYTYCFSIQYEEMGRSGVVSLAGYHALVYADQKMLQTMEYIVSSVENYEAYYFKVERNEARAVVSDADWPKVEDWLHDYERGEHPLDVLSLELDLVGSGCGTRSRSKTDETHLGMKGIVMKESDFFLRCDTLQAASDQAVEKGFKAFLPQWGPIHWPSVQMDPRNLTALMEVYTTSISYIALINNIRLPHTSV